MATNKRVDASILLDSERYDQLRAYQKRKGTESLDDALTLVVNTGLSRIAALENHQSKQPAKEKKPRKEKAPKAKPQAKVKAKAAAKGTKKKAAKKVEADKKPVAAAAKKVQKGGAKVAGTVKVQKSGATVSRLAPQRPQPALSPVAAPSPAPANGAAAPTALEVAEA